MLNMLELALQDENFGFVRLDGTMDTKSRAMVVNRFNDTPTSEIMVFLISLKAGGVGLNLVRANHCIMMDSWFNRI